MSAISDRLAELDSELLLADGFDTAVIGVAYSAQGRPVVAYNTASIIEILMYQHSMTNEEAQEFFEYNVIGSYMGERTPVFIDILEV